MKTLIQTPEVIEKEIVVEKITKMKDSIVEVEDGFEQYLGKTVTFFCLDYIYSDKLVGVNSTRLKLEDAHIVYETGAFTDKKWHDAQKLPGFWYIQVQSITSWGILK